MKLSFVIPAYNEEAYVGKCLESIFKETEGKNYDYEIIVVNNASTDNTKKIASSFKKVKVIDEPKKGLVNARRAGYLVSKGDLIANVDSDTILTPGWIERVFYEFSKNKNLAGLSGPFLYYDVPKWMIKTVKVFYYYAFGVYLLNRFVLKQGSMLQGGNFVVRRSSFIKAGEFNDNYDFYGEDADIARRLHKVGAVKWTFNFPIYASARRLAKEGPVTTSFRYTINYIWTFLFKKPFSKSSSDVRFAKVNKILKINPENKKTEIIGSIITILALALLPLTIAGFIYHAMRNKLPAIAKSSKDKLFS